MKASSLTNFIFIIFLIAMFLFVYVAVLNEIKNMSKEKINKIESLSEKQNRVQMKTVEIQKLTSEDRIVSLAKDSIGLMRPLENLDIIYVSPVQIKRIENFVKEKYD